ncbi:hypothetical protein OEA41_008036 [Lepraria neglecta]|uniref:Uncharacterized protein n=1 Tax=Lepraria neglecta TaxID=209136 RepID=A0AAE0DNH9_9LECA|nr:hypothetical protein OEA41_008036 [Lepraria neglecta]
MPVVGVLDGFYDYSLKPTDIPREILLTDIGFSNIYARTLQNTRELQERLTDPRDNKPHQHHNSESISSTTSSGDTTLVGSQDTGAGAAFLKAPSPIIFFGIPFSMMHRFLNWLIPILEACCREGKAWDIYTATAKDLEREEILEGAEQLRHAAVHRRDIEVKHLWNAMLPPEILGDMERDGEIVRVFDLVCAASAQQTSCDLPRQGTEITKRCRASRNYDNDGAVLGHVHNLMRTLMVLGDYVAAIEVEIAAERWFTGATRKEVLRRLRGVYLVEDIAHIEYAHGKRIERKRRVAIAEILGAAGMKARPPFSLGRYFPSRAQLGRVGLLFIRVFLAIGLVVGSDYRFLVIGTYHALLIVCLSLRPTAARWMSFMEPLKFYSPPEVITVTEPDDWIARRETISRSTHPLLKVLPVPEWNTLWILAREQGDIEWEEIMKSTRKDDTDGRDSNSDRGQDWWRWWSNFSGKTTEYQEEYDGNEKAGENDFNDSDETSVDEASGEDFRTDEADEADDSEKTAIEQVCLDPKDTVASKGTGADTKTVSE